MSSALAPITTHDLLNPSVISKLQTWEDFLSFYIQLDQVASISAWLKADTLYALSKKFGETSLAKFSTDIKQPRSTIINYVRVAKAFPPEKRIPDVSFSLHFQASFADNYDEKKGEFLSDTRKEWVEKAVDSGWSTRVLADQIQQQKKKTELQVEYIRCAKCHHADEHVVLYIFYAPGLKDSLKKFNLHPVCYNTLLTFLEE